ncbi:hypothetical protein [Paracoccus denitrificans]|jgi:hypothetical protein|uniref:hypothetical protein n=1 Tax=Paracoccus denitrificans TaxID=266 RepID=UPI00032096CB|nr:hypothetical protein [Paracoccus denitrificans]MBB4625797.1 hypothetical protein [Paracoccus denitrificans]MCU7427038.1 hypothetical protein [Paracoccus denitrificans]QAR26558.1 hypothetical protein EO213_09760 [Paracoccus denitrificans]UPV95499.1 hypothetical protein M0K93_02595 [Paracoccus denitrificans]WQO32436.1 hypothetical protein U0005_08845 [Paracoccus denitrificans]
MAKAIFHRRFDATDTTKGVSIRIEPMEKPQSYPEWVIAKAVAAGAATRAQRKTEPALPGAISKDE